MIYFRGLAPSFCFRNGTKSEVKVFVLVTKLTIPIFPTLCDCYHDLPSRYNMIAMLTERFSGGYYRN